MPINKTIILPELSYKIMGALFAVHTELGPFNQTLAYLKETNLPLAILVNFRRPRLEYKRIINSSTIRV